MVITYQIRYILIISNKMSNKPNKPEGIIVPIRLSEGQRNKTMQMNGNVKLKFTYEDMVSPNMDLAIPPSQYAKLSRTHSKGVMIAIPKWMVKKNQDMYDPKGGNFLSSLLPLAKMAFTK